MAQLELTITHDYIRWGIWECLRELIQNARDADIEGHDMNIKYYPRTERVEIINKGATLTRDKLLLGQTTKRLDDRQAGQFGEGFKLAFAGLLQMGHEITVDTGQCLEVVRDLEGGIDETFEVDGPKDAYSDDIKTERWTPNFGRSDTFDDDLLQVNTRLIKYDPDVRIEVTDVTPEQWEDVKSNVRFLGDASEEVVETEEGTILKDAPGEVYSHGLYIQTLFGDCKWGYDIPDLDIDRDRNVVPKHEVKFSAEKMIKDAYESGKLSDEDVYEILKDGDTLESKVLAQFYDINEHGMAGGLIGQFRDEYGDQAVPVKTTSQSKEAEYYGLRGVRVERHLRQALINAGIGLEDAKKERSMQVESYAWHELSQSEKDCLEAAIDTIPDSFPGGGDIKKPLEVDVVDFPDSSTKGRCHDDGKIELSRDLLDDPSLTLSTLAHEVAHLDGSKDFTVEHRNRTELLLAHIAIHGTRTQK